MQVEFLKLDRYYALEFIFSRQCVAGAFADKRRSLEMQRNGIASVDIVRVRGIG